MPSVVFTLTQLKAAKQANALIQIWDKSYYVTKVRKHDVVLTEHSNAESIAIVYRLKNDGPNDESNGIIGTRVNPR